MARKKEKRQGYGKILDTWTQPEKSGSPVGCVATSFTFSPAFFEEECLSRFLGIETDPIEDGPLYLVEREEKLSQIVCAAALVDQHNCKGSRNLRWDMLPARLKGGVLHAKISVLYWTERLRIIVASANLTEDGYRRNQEIFGAVDYYPGSKVPLAVAKEIIEFLRLVVKSSERDTAVPSPALTRWNSFLERINNIPGNWGVETREIGGNEIQVLPIFSGPDYPNVFKRLESVWPGRVPPKRAYVVSPFFDPPDAPNRPVKELWNIMRKRGEASVGFSVSAEEVPGEETLYIHAPKSLLTSQPTGQRKIRTALYRVDLDPGRPLHAKGVWLDDNRWAVYMIGSSNFTSAGMGFSSSGNLEANLAYLVNHARNPEAYKNLERSFIEGEEIDLDKSPKWQPRSDEGEDGPGVDLLLPEAFASAVYDCDDKKQPTVTFTFTKTPPKGWRLISEDEKLFFTETDWLEQGKPERITVAWADDRPPSGFWVIWNNSSGSAWLPVNVATTGSLPPPEQLKDLPLEILINILTSACPLHRVLGTYWKRSKKTGDGVTDLKNLVDPHARVDTSKFLLQRTRRVSWALNALRERIERPTVSEECLNWRLWGPVGVMQLANAIVREAQSDHEKAFLISELALELARAKPQEAINCLPKGVVREGIKKAIFELEQQIDFKSLKEEDTLKTYVESVFSMLSS